MLEARMLEAKCVHLAPRFCRRYAGYYSQLSPLFRQIGASQRKVRIRYASVHQTLLSTEPRRPVIQGWALPTSVGSLTGRNSGRIISSHSDVDVTTQDRMDGTGWTAGEFGLRDA